MVKTLDSYTIKGTDIVIRPGDCVLVKALAPIRFPYVARVENLIVDSLNKVKVYVLWYYRPQDTAQGRKCFHGLRELLLSDHHDWLNAKTIYDKCQVLTFDGYSNLDKVTTRDYFSRFGYKAAEKEYAEDYNVRTHCKCQMPFNPDLFMVLCDGCDQWFQYPSCLEITNEDAEATGEFFCPDCGSI